LLGVCLVAVAAAACGSHAGGRLADGTVPRTLPDRVRSAARGATFTRLRVLRRTAADGLGFADCRRRAGVAVPAGAVVVERVTSTGISFTTRVPPGLFGCDVRPGAHPGRATRACAMTTGRFERGHLLDPRLTIACGFGRKQKLAFAWVQPRARTRWLLVHDGRRREVYDVADDLPVRIAISEHVSERDATASADVDELSAAGVRIAREHLLLRLAG
jgi:hypothetical protein